MYRRSRALRTVSCIGSKMVTCFWSLRLPLNQIYLFSRIMQSTFIDLTRNMSIAICFPLSWKLLMYARETLLVASDNKPNYTIDAGASQAKECLPASVCFPLRVKLVFRAPVPAYILDKASPFSAHNSRWFVHSCIEASHSRRISSRYCSSVVFDKTSSTKLVLSRLVMARHQKNCPCTRTAVPTNLDNLSGKHPSAPWRSYLLRRHT